MSMSLTDPAPRALRLDLALEAGLSLPDAGTIAVFHPRAGEDLSPLPAARLQVVTPLAPDAEAFAARRLACVTAPEGRYGATMVCLPRARAEARDLLARAAALTDGPVIVDGQKTDGVEAVLRELRARVDLSEALSKGHGKIAWFNAAGVDLSDWLAEPATVTDAQGQAFRTLPGLFSADGIDPASALLAQTVPAGLKGVVADLGAGWGYLSQQMLARAPGIAELHLIEADARALDCARVNVADPRARFHWADATRPMPGLALDAVVMNPPFHSGREARPQLGTAFIAAAAAMLKPSGQLWLVANRHLPYETALTDHFRAHTELAGTPGFKILHAEGPIRTAPAAPARRLRATHSTGRRA